MPNDPATTASRARFDTTRWSLVAAADSKHSDVAGEALNDLCRAYWRPIYAEIRRRGHAADASQDLTQDFFARLLRHEAFGRADREKGRFRTFLLGALDFFLIDHLRSKQALRRGGGEILLPFSTQEGESWFREQPAYGSTPAEAFDQQWAVVLMDRALEALRDEYRATGRENVFTAVEPFLTADSGADGYEEVCGQISLTPQAFAVAVHRVRRRFRACVREQVERTVRDPAEAALEMKHLFGL
ncbi:MAG: sigma-70 family RNA polymerase sigma factor [Prosthecobacter sp.]|uniref:RNA polymerase sigma factor n=1 Tax=Prosthecobacter sp. TaxID=1965333 RepID=UPI0019F150EB|nr:sigma factor [Prosthecobacter sp.]MBE2285537.1 sigma-70 family RNA polymerase sigma factor [Prosthecobacter sp.]